MQSEAADAMSNSTKMAMFGVSACQSAAETAAAHGVHDSKTGCLTGYTPFTAISPEEV